MLIGDKYHRIELDDGQQLSRRLSSSILEPHRKKKRKRKRKKKNKKKNKKKKKNQTSVTVP